MLDVRKEQTPSDPSGLEIPSTGIYQRRSGDLLQVGSVLYVGSQGSPRVRERVRL